MAENVSIDRFLDAAEEPVETLTPIAGYEMVDLVPLEIAVKPLEPLLYNLNNMVQTARRNSRQPADGLTQDESAAIRLYTIQWPKPHPSLFTLLNQRLRSQDRDTLAPWYLYLKLFLTALYKLPSITNRVIWRGIHGDISDQYQEDQIWWGASSCTETMQVLGKFIGRDGVRTLFIIECMDGKAIRAHSQYALENEILLMPGAFLQVIGKWTPSQDLHIVHLRQTTPPYQTITPPVQLTQSSSSLENLRISNETDSTSSGSQPSKPSPVSISTEPKTATSKVISTSIVTQMSAYQNARLEELIIANRARAELKLVLMGLKDPDMEIVAHLALRNNQTLTVLNISSNEIGEQGAEHLSHGLRSNRTLSKLSLFNNGVGAQGVQYLTQALRNNTEIKEFNICAEAFENHVTLTELYLAFNQIGEEGAKYLSHFLKGSIALIILDLASNEIKNKGIEYLTDGLKNNKTLDRLDISFNEIGDAGIEYLSEELRINTTLHTLNLQNNQFGRKGMEHLNNALQNNTTLTTLGLSSDQFQQEEIRYLAELREKNTRLTIP